MTDADNVFVIPDPWPFQFLPQSFFKYSYHSVCTGCLCIYTVYVCVCVFLNVRLEKGDACDLGLPQRDCLDTAFSCLTELSGMLRYGKKEKKQNNPVRVCMSAHLYSPSDNAAIRLTFSPPPHPVSHGLQLMRTAEQNVSGPQCHLNNTPWLWLLAQDFEYYFKVTILKVTV